MRNYLLDRHFQLKYTGYLVAIAVVISVALGIALWLTSRQVIDQSQTTVTQGEQVVDVVARSLTRAARSPPSSR
jgi:hypothetical protein